MFLEPRISEGQKVTAVVNLAIKVLKAWERSIGLKTHKAGTLKSPLVNEDDFSSDEERCSHVDQQFVYAKAQVLMVDSKEMFDSIQPQKKSSNKANLKRIQISADEASPELREFIFSCLNLAIHDLMVIEKYVGDMLFESEVTYF
jgi:hypothetical protein